MKTLAEAVVYLMALVTPTQQEFLQSLADGSAWHEFDYPEAE
jgi:hypothetical protein